MEKHELPFILGEILLGKPLQINVDGKWKRANLKELRNMSINTLSKLEIRPLPKKTIKSIMATVHIGCFEAKTRIKLSSLNLNQKTDIGTEIFRKQIQNQYPLRETLGEIMELHRNDFESKVNMVLYIMLTYEIKRKIWDFMMHRPNIIAEKFELTKQETYEVVENYINQRNEKAKN